jgi:hypothetical protein
MVVQRTKRSFYDFFNSDERISIKQKRGGIRPSFFWGKPAGSGRLAVLQHNDLPWIVHEPEG